MRWHHAERGWVPPSVFIPLAEQSDLILELGSFALHESIAAASAWGDAKDMLAEPVRIGQPLRAPVPRPRTGGPRRTRVGRRARSRADRLIIEITEGVALMEVADTLSVIEQLTSLGIGVALDDFGTGLLVALVPRAAQSDDHQDRPVLRSTDDREHSQ